MERSAYGKWLRAARRAKRLTQQQLADAVGIDRSYVVKIETGKVQLPEEFSRARFHKVLETSEDELIALGIVQPNDVLIRVGEPAIAHATVQASCRLRTRDRPWIVANRTLRITTGLR